MDALIIIASVIGIVTTFGSTAANIYQIGIQHLSSKVRQAVQSLAKDISQQLKNGRANVTKLLSLLQSKNTNALMNYLYNNPVISKRLDELQANSDLIASLQADQTNLENEITALQNELATLGYSTSIRGSRKDEKRAKEINDEIKVKSKEYNDLGDKIKNANFSTVSQASTYTADLDARSQNIQGGLVK